MSAVPRVPRMDIATALVEALVSPNEDDSNMEAANVVDGLFAIARSLGAIARAIDDLGDELTRHWSAG